MKTLLKAVLAVIVMSAVAVSAVAGESYTPNGSVTVSMSDRFVSPTLSTVRDVPYGVLDVWLNLPAGFSLQATEYIGFNDDDFDSDKNDEFDATAWKKFTLASSTYLKLRVKYINLMPVSDISGDDLLAYDVYVGRSWNWDGPNTVAAELRLQYWHYSRDIDEGMFILIPTLAHEYRAGMFTFYDRVSLLWNEELAPFGEMVNVQPVVGLKLRLTPSLNWNVVDIAGVLPLTEVEDGDPRTDGKVAYTTALNWRF